ncbi:hypothetical protein [Streptomyces syringium]|uniref:hypothetical protein n=1 Tax=Streptomyces syringium TaxID=76729 RepID=UPI0034556BCC
MQTVTADTDGRPSSGLTVTVSALMVEMAFAAAALWSWGVTHPGPEDESGALAVVALPFLLPVVAGVALLLALTLVLPTVALARRAGVWWGGAGAWWWIPAMASGVSAAGVTVVGVGAGLRGGVAAPGVYLWWWLAVTALIVPAGLLSRLARRRAGQGRPVRARTVLFGGCAGVVAFFMALLTVALGVESVLG